MRRLALAVLLVSSGAAARSVVQSDGEANARVTAVRGELSGATAMFRVSYAYDVDGAIYGSSIAPLELPATALVVGATVRRDGRMHRLDLLAADRASKQWDALASDEEHQSGALRSAVLIAGESGAVTLSIASPRPGRLEIQLEIASQTCFFNDARYVVIPETWGRLVHSTLRTIAKPSDELAEACASLGDGTWIAFATLEVARRRSGDRVGAFAGRLVSGEDHIVRVEVDLATVLADVPRDLATVLVVDASRSMTEEQREAQRELVLSYLRGAKDTRVQVIAYARTARPLLPSWSVASRATVRVERELRALAPRNGSNLDSGLAEAGAWLSQLEGTHRVVLVTDELMSSRLQAIQPATLKRALPAGTLVHVVSTVGGGDGVARDDSVELGALAAATDGMAVRVHKGLAPIDATMLVRPIGIDQLAITAPGWTQFEPAVGIPTCGAVAELELAAGRSCAWWGHGDVTSGPIAIAGLMWGTRVTRVLRPDPAHGLEITRELSLSSTLETELLERIQRMARGVNQHWSLYSEWGGARRYYEGFGFGRSGTCCGGGSFSSQPSIGIGRIGTMHRNPDDLTGQLAPAVAACQLGDERVSVQIEMTLLEIVDVTVEVHARTRTNPNELRKLRACVEDVIWDASPMLRIPLSHSQHAATFGGKP